MSLSAMPLRPHCCATSTKTTPSGRVVVEMASLRRLDAPLAEAMSELARELGYGQLISSA